MTIREQIEGEGNIIGNRARLNGVIYERRANGDWRRAKQQAQALRAFSRAVRQAEIDAQVRAEVESRLKPQAVPYTKERQTPTLRVTGSRAQYQDFLRWVERQRQAG